MVSSDRELAAFKFLDGLNAHLKDVREPQKALRHGLRDTREFFRAASGCIATLQAGRPEADVLFTLPKGGTWNLDVVTRFIRHAHPPVEHDMLIAPLRRRKGPWGAIALSRPGLAFDRYDGRLLARTAAALSEAIHRIDRDRMGGVRDRIDRKIMEQIDPKDLFYQILDGLRSLTQYDHSSALLIREEGDSTLRVVAEQIAWIKAKSQRIGLQLPMTPEAAAMLHSEQVYGFDRHAGVGRPGEANQRPPRWPSCSTTTVTMATGRAVGKRRCCARRWSRGMVLSAC